jgi:hypothetical protein
MKVTTCFLHCNPLSPLNEAWLAASGVSIDSLPVSLTQSDIDRMKRQGYLGAGWAR